MAESIVVSIDTIPRLVEKTGKPVSFFLDMYYEHTKRGSVATVKLADLMKEEKGAAVQHS